MKLELTCIVCPNSCQLELEVEQTVEGSFTLRSVSGASCPRGVEYARQETCNPCRNIATSIAVLNGTLPLASVRSTHPVPKKRIFDVMNEIKKHVVPAPVTIGTVLIHNVLGLDSDVIITKNVPRKNDAD